MVIALNCELETLPDKASKLFTFSRGLNIQRLM